MSKTYPAIDIQFTTDSTVDLSDRLLAGLDDFQPTAIHESEDAWRVFFDSAEVRDNARAWTLGIDAGVEVSSIDVPDEDWARRSQADLKPVRVGRIVVAPPWALPDLLSPNTAPPPDITIVIVPSTGFGTGHHASTRLCLRLLQELSVEGRSVLDIGTGSGVLAIAAARLGAGSVTAVDDDPDAIEAASENAGLNPTDVVVALHTCDFRETPQGPAEIVLANLTGGMLRAAAGAVAGCTANAGYVVVSGVLAAEEADVVARFEAAGLRHVKTLAEEEWIGALFQKGR